MKSVLALGLVTALLAVPTSARADTEPTHEVRALFNEANRLFDKGDYTASLDLYRRAHAAFPSAKILLNIAACLVKLDRLAEAANTFQAYLRHPEASTTKQRAIEGTLTELRRKVGRLRISASVAGARILVDDVDVGTSPLTDAVHVAPGAHVIRVETPSGNAAPARVTVAAGEEGRIDLTIAAPAAPAANTSVTTGTAPAPASLPASAAHAAPVAIGASTDHAASSGAIVGASGRRPGRLAGLLAVDVDGRARGAVAVAGASFRVLDRIEISAAALLGARVGFQPAVTAILSDATFAPVVTLAAPLLFENDLIAGVKGSAGVRFAPTPRIAIYLELGAAWFPSAGPEWETFAILPSLGMLIRI